LILDHGSASLKKDTLEINPPTKENFARIFYESYISESQKKGLKIIPTAIKNKLAELGIK
jgi:hypothetical protein